MATAAKPPQPGSRRLRRLARARPARLQLPDRRHPRRDRPRTAREARRDPRRRGLPLRRGTRSSLADVAVSSSRAPTTRITSARGSSTSSRSRAGADREAVIASLADRGVQTARYLPCIHLQPYMQERYRLSRRPLPGRRGRRLAHAGASVPRAARRGRPGVRRRGAPRSAGVVSTRARARARRWSSGRSGRVMTLVVVVTYAGSTRRRCTTCRAKGIAGGLSRGLDAPQLPDRARRDRARAARCRRASGGAPGGPRRPRSRSARRSPGSSTRTISTHAGSTRSRRSASLSRSASPSLPRVAQGRRSRRDARGTAGASRSASRRARLPAVDHRGARLPLPRRRLHGRGARPGGDGTSIAAVHLGHHHGMDGALLVAHRAPSLARRRSPARGLRVAFSRTSGRCSRTAA